MPMTDGRVPRFAALVREAAAVLAAILIAFALDAWWDERVEQRDMLEALDAVATELQRNVEEIRSSREYNTGRGQLVAEAFELLDRDLAALPDEELLRFANLPNYVLVTLELGAASAFIEGGYLAALDDRDLRANIAGIPRFQAEMDEEAGTVLNASERLNVALLDQVPVEQMLGAGPDGAPTAAAILEGLRGSEAVQRAFAARTFFLTFLYGTQLEAIETRMEEILAEIEAYRGG